MIAHPSSTDGADGWQSVEALFGDFAEVCLHEERGEEEEKGGGKLKKKKKKAAFNAVIWVQVSRLIPLLQGLERRWTPPDSRGVSPALSPALCLSFAPCPGYNAPRLSLPLPPTHRPWLWEGAASIPEHLWSPPGRGQRGHWDSREVRRGILRVSLLFYLFIFLRGFFFFLAKCSTLPLAPPFARCSLVPDAHTVPEKAKTLFQAAAGRAGGGVYGQ